MLKLFQETLSTQYLKKPEKEFNENLLNILIDGTQYNPNHKHYGPLEKLLNYHPENVYIDYIEKMGIKKLEDITKIPKNVLNDMFNKYDLDDLKDKMTISIPDILKDKHRNDNQKFNIIKKSLQHSIFIQNSGIKLKTNEITNENDQKQLLKLQDNYGHHNFNWILKMYNKTNFKDDIKTFEEDFNEFRNDYFKIIEHLFNKPNYFNFFKYFVNKNYSPKRINEHFAKNYPFDWLYTKYYDDAITDNEIEFLKRKSNNRNSEINELRKIYKILMFPNQIIENDDRIALKKLIEQKYTNIRVQNEYKNWIEQINKHRDDEFEKFKKMIVDDDNNNNNNDRDDDLNLEDLPEKTFTFKNTPGGKSDKWELDEQIINDEAINSTFKQFNMLIEQVNNPKQNSSLPTSRILQMIYQNYKLVNIYKHYFPKNIKINLTDVNVWEHKKYYTPQTLNSDKYSLFIFGENDKLKGTNTKQDGTQAIIRGRGFNLSGIRTCYRPSKGFRDNTLENNKKMIDDDINEIKIKYNYLKNSSPTKNIRIHFPFKAMGEGVAQLPDNAPKTWKYLTDQIEKHFGLKLGHEHDKGYYWYQI